MSTTEFLVRSSLSNRPIDPLLTHVHCCGNDLQDGKQLFTGMISGWLICITLTERLIITTRFLMNMMSGHSLEWLLQKRHRDTELDPMSCSLALLSFSLQTSQRKTLLSLIRIMCPDHNPLADMICVIGRSERTECKCYLKYLVKLLGFTPLSFVFFCGACLGCIKLRMTVIQNLQMSLFWLLYSAVLYNGLSIFHAFNSLC